MPRRSALTLALSGLAIAAVLGIVWGCTPTPPPHPAIGNWRNGLLSLIVYPDNVATVNGIECDWKAVDGATIRVYPRGEAKVSDSGPVIKVAFNLRVLEGQRQAILDLFGFPLTLDREEEPPSS